MLQWGRSASLRQDPGWGPKRRRMKLAKWRRFAILVAIVALLGLWASPADAQSTGQFTRAEASPDWTTGSFAGSITWTNCNAGCDNWVGEALVEPSTFTCNSFTGTMVGNPNIARVWLSGTQSANATVPFDVSEARLLPGIDGQRLCLIVVQVATIGEPVIKTLETHTLLASTVFTVATSPANKPSSKALPKIKGRAEVGTKLTVSRGSWAGTFPIAYKYQWKRCNGKGKNCKGIKGATKSSFTPSKKYIGKRLKVAVTASNSAGKTTVNSKASKAVSA